MSICREVNAMIEAMLQGLDEVAGMLRGAPAHKVRGDQLRICINGRPNPHIAVPKFAFMRGGNVLFLRVREGPDSSH
jgi:hypothetical protein